MKQQRRFIESLNYGQKMEILISSVTLVWEHYKIKCFDEEYVMIGNVKMTYELAVEAFTPKSWDKNTFRFIACVRNAGGRVEYNPDLDKLDICQGYNFKFDIPVYKTYDMENIFEGDIQF